MSLAKAEYYLVVSSVWNLEMLYYGQNMYFLNFDNNSYFLKGVARRKKITILLSVYCKDNYIHDMR